MNATGSQLACADLGGTGTGEGEAAGHGRHRTVPGWSAVTQGQHKSGSGSCPTEKLWLGVNNRGPMTANGIYQMIARRGRQAGWTRGRTGSGITSAIPGSTEEERRET